jgi:hypothetical protein
MVTCTAGVLAPFAGVSFIKYQSVTISRQRIHELAGKIQYFHPYSAIQVVILQQFPKLAGFPVQFPLQLVALTQEALRI